MKVSIIFRENSKNIRENHPTSTGAATGSKDNPLFTAHDIGICNDAVNEQFIRRNEQTARKRKEQSAKTPISCSFCFFAGFSRI
jgi:hypothetical protein